MKKTLALLVLSLVVLDITAQNNAEIEISYTTNEPNFRTGEIDVHHRYILLANTTESKFYSPLTEYIDSLRSTPEGEAKYKEMSRGAIMGGKMDDVPRRDGNFYIVKNSADARMTTYDLNGLEKFRIEEPIPQWDWQISDSTRNILGYECYEASTRFHGREWTVWFTPDIPVMDGPWKLCGLPGIILEATDKSGTYSFIADGVRPTTRPIGPVYSANDYDKIDRTDFLKAKRKMTDDPISQMNAQLSGMGISLGSIGNERLYKTREEVDFLETDY